MEGFCLKIIVIVVIVIIIIVVIISVTKVSCCNVQILHLECNNAAGIQ